MVAAGGGEAGVEDADELFGFLEDGWKAVEVFDEGDAVDEFEPAVGFAKFFEGDAHFVDEVFSGFGGLSLAVVGHG